MSVTSDLLAALSQYGLPVLFVSLVSTSAGIPFPAALIGLAAGSFVAQGELKLWQVYIVASTGCVLGDQIGYGLGRWGGRQLADKITKRVGGTSKIAKAEALTRRWGAAGIFLSRWLVTPLGPWINVTSGITDYAWPRFLLWDVLGQALWAVSYVTLGTLFSDRIQGLAGVLGDFGWVFAGGCAAVLLGWKVWRSLTA